MARFVGDGDGSAFRERTGDPKADSPVLDFFSGRSFFAIFERQRTISTQYNRERESRSLWTSSCVVFVGSDLECVHCASNSWDMAGD